MSKTIRQRDKECKEKDCPEPAHCRDMCEKHYNQWRKTRTDGVECKEEDCHNPVLALGWCEMHHGRVRRHGTPDRVIDISGDQCIADPDCKRPPRAKQMCDTHYNQWNKEQRLPTQPECTETDCHEPQEARGWCNKHYELWRRNGAPDTQKNLGIVKPLKRDEQCSVSEFGKQCDSLVGQYGGLGMCQKHNNRRKRHGDPLVVLICQDYGGALCAFPDIDCPDLATTKGLCPKHYKTMYARQRREDGYKYVQDPVARRESQAKWDAKQTPEQKRDRAWRSILTKHGVTPEWWHATWAEQSESCGTGCGSIEPGGIGTWHIDHDHNHCPGSSGCAECVRGIVCHGCNTGMGFLKDDPAMLRLAADYLDKHAMLASARRLLASPGALCLFG